MKFAIWDNFQPREGVSPTQHFEEHLREVEIAEECGFHHYWFLEHHLSPRSPLPSPSILIGLALARTSRIRIGNMVNILPFRNPIIMAEEIAMLDTISGGRVDTGVGRGLKPTEFDTFCLDQNNSREMLNESLEIMTRIWKDENFAFEGKHFSVNKTTPMAPSVVQKPYPPIFISAQSEESIRWAAENDIHFGQIDAPVDECRRDCDLYREIQIASGHKPTPRLFLTREIFIGRTNEEARQRALKYLKEYWELWGRYTQFTEEGRMPDSYATWRKRAPALFAKSYDELIDENLIFVGSAEYVADQINKLAEQLDVAVLACVFHLGSLPHKEVVRSMNAFAEQVLPRVSSPELLSA